MERVSNGLARFKDPEYTGENRCLPCTAVNLCIAFVLALAVGIVVITTEASGPALLLPEALFVVAVAAIYFRGYLVPGTPELTKRYFPQWLLAAFGKDEPATGLGNDSLSEEKRMAIDPESLLLDAGVLTERAGGEDLQLTAEFRRTLADQVDDVKDEDVSRERLLDLLEVDPGEVEFEEHGEAFRVYYDETVIGTWESRPAFLADVAAAELLRDRVDSWAEMSVMQRGTLLNGLRLFLMTCPGCGGELSFGVNTVESCCTTREVAAVTCEDCEARVFESGAI